jgi:hypothetical protein
MSEQENLYKLYNITDKKDYEGSTVKCECTINGEYGLFKERMSMQSKDNVMEDVAYRVAELLGVPCAFASCRKYKNIIGSFSRYEIPKGYDFIHLSSIYGVDELNVVELLRQTILKSNNKVSNIVTEIYKYIIFDYIMGQRDRHLGNLALLRNKNSINNKLLMYKLYDNGLCCFSTESNDNAIEMLNHRYYSSRIGTNEDIALAIQEYRKLISPGDLREIVQYDKVNEKVLKYYFEKVDKYHQIGKERQQASIKFIMRNTLDIHRINNRTFRMEDLYV